MPQKCCVPNCKVESDDPVGRNLSFHVIPASEQESQKWIQSIVSYFGKLEKKKYMYVCGRHFHDSAFYYTDCGRRKIKKGCYPTNFEYTKNEFASLTNSTHEPDVLLEIADSSGRRCPEKADADTVKTFCSEDNSNQQQVKEIESSKPKSSLDTVKNSANIYTDHIYSKVYKESSKPETIVDTEKSPLINNTDHMSVDSRYSKKNSKNNKNIKRIYWNFKKSLAKLDLESIDFSQQDKLKYLFKSAQEEVITLHRKVKSLQMKLLRKTKVVKNLQSLLVNMKKKKYISSKLLKVLKEEL